MSWKWLTILLVICGIAAFFLGYPLGYYLKGRAEHLYKEPQADTTQNDPNPRINPETGVPLDRVPPQPLMSGSMGIPPTLPIVDWRIDPKNRTPDDQLALSSSGVHYSLTKSNTNVKFDQTNVTTIDSSRFAGLNSDVKNKAEWIEPFRQAMAVCRSQSFRDRPMCLRKTREQYCGAHNAWGLVVDCPPQNQP